MSADRAGYRQVMTFDLHTTMKQTANCTYTNRALVAPGRRVTAKKWQQSGSKVSATAPKVIRVAVSRRRSVVGSVTVTPGCYWGDPEVTRVRRLLTAWDTAQPGQTVG